VDEGEGEGSMGVRERPPTVGMAAARVCGSTAMQAAKLGAGVMRLGLWRDLRKTASHAMQCRSACQP